MRIHKTILPLLVLAAGCGEPYGVKDVGENARFRGQESSASADGRLSEPSAQYLRRQGLPLTADRKTRNAIDAVLKHFADRPTRSAALALAELCFMEGTRHPAPSDEAGRSFLASAIFAYAFLFDPQLSGTCSPFDRRYSIACETYNRALSRVLSRHPLSESHWADGATLQSLVGPIRIDGKSWTLPWRQTQINRFESAFRNSVKGIEDPARQNGIGVPLIAVESAEMGEQAGDLSAFQQPLPMHALAATLCIRFHGSIVDAVRNPGTGLTADVSVLDPFTNDSIEIAGRRIPLESEIVAPLAYAIEHTPRVSGFKGFLDTESWGDRKGLFMEHPYQKGKIPVVFTYGLTGKPTTWVLMYNHLVANETLRNRFQFWYFMYPTGNPVLYSAAELRGQLIKAQKLFDPDGTDPTFNQMVLVGHSMGGLLTRLQVTDSGDALWNAVMQRPFDLTNTPDESAKLIKSVFFFDSQPFVKRVIFMATPHRGSALADSRFARDFSAHVKLSDEVRIAAEKYFHPPATTTLSTDHVPTAVESLSAENPVLLAVDRLPIPPRTKYHSIIANRDAANQPGGTDSIVPYTSSHLDGVASETIIHSKHGCTRNPDAIREVERILLLHLAEIDKQERSRTVLGPDLRENH